MSDVKSYQRLLAVQALYEFTINKKDKDVEIKAHNIDDLLIKIGKLEKAAKSDAAEIDRLIKKLKEILETNND